MAYDGFISYSHSADGRLAPAVQAGLQRLARPWYRRRALRVFRDETGLTVNPHLWGSIAVAMDESRYFVVLLSPDAAESQWVNRELSYWLESHPSDTVLPVLTDGTLVWSDALGDFDPALSTALPAALAGAFLAEPRHLDLRWAKDETHLDLRHSQFRAQIATLAATLHGVPRDELEGEDVRLHRRALRLAWATAVALVILLLGSTMLAAAAVSNARDANHERNAAVDARHLADANAQRADANAQRADANAYQADANAQRADVNADEAGKYAVAADANAQRAASSAATAQQNLDSAVAAQQQADASAADAQANAEQARLAKLDSDAAAASARLQEEAAEAASAAADASAAEARRQQQAAESARTSADQANQATQSANQALSTANSDLDASRLVALADNERIRGNFDTAMLLANEAIAVEKTDRGVSRNEALAIQAESRSIVRYLPGSPTSAGATAQVITGRDRVAVISGDGTLRIWRLSQPDAQPTELRDVLRDGVFAAQFSADGSRLVVSGFGVSVIDADRAGGARLWTSELSLVPPQLSPDGTTVAVEELTDAGEARVVLVRLTDGVVKATWTGHLVSSLVSVGGGFLGVDCAAPSPGACEFSPDGRYLLGWTEATGAFVSWDSLHPQRIVTLYTPAFPPDSSIPAPRFVGTDGSVVAAVDPDTVVVFDSEGAAGATLHLTTPLRGFAVTEDGQTAVVLESSGTLSRFDLASGLFTEIAQVTNSCPIDDARIAFSRRSQWAIITGLSGCESPVLARAFVPMDGSPEPVPFVPSTDPFTSGQIAVTTDADGFERFAIVATGDVLDLASQNVLVRIDPGQGSRCTFSPRGHRGVCGKALVDLDRFDPSFAVRRTLGIPSLGFAPPIFDETETKLFGLVFTNGGRVWEANLEGTGVGAVRYSELTTSPPFQLPVAALSPDGTLLATATAAGVELHSLVDRTRTTLHDPRLGAIESISFAGRDRLLVHGLDMTVFEQFADVWNVPNRQLMKTVQGRIAASGDGQVLAVSECGPVGEGCAIDVVSAVDFRIIRRGLPHPEAGPFALNHDGSLLVTLTSRGTQLSSDATVVDTRSGTRVAQVATEVPTTFGAQLAFSPDNTSVTAAFVVNDLFMARIELKSSEVAQLIAADRKSDCPWGTAQPTYSADGRLLFVAGQLVDGVTLSPLGSPVTCENRGALAAAFASNGDALDYVSATRIGADTQIDVHHVSLRLDDLYAAACAAAGHNLSANDWDRFRPGVAYRRTCDQWP